MKKKKSLCPIESMQLFQQIYKVSKGDPHFNKMSNDRKADWVLVRFLDIVKKTHKKKSIQRDIREIFSLFIKRNRLYLSYE